MDERTRAIELLNSFSTAMLVTHGHDGSAARPMQIAKVDPDGRVWFLSGTGSEKVDAISEDADVLVVCQNERSSYLALKGTARLTTDRAKVRELWSEPYRVWFPEGPDDPSLVLIDVRPRWAEYWDQRGSNKLRYLFEAATAYVSGERPRVKEGEQHGRTPM